MKQTLSKQAQRVQESLDKHGVKLEVVELPDSTRTAQDAATALNCEVAHIAKSLIFKGNKSEKPYLIIASGSNRVDENLLSNEIEEEIAIAEAEFVKEATGFIVGGIPPVGHIQNIPTYIDEDLMNFEAIWAAAGTSHAVFKLTPKQLQEITKGKIVKVS